MSKQHNIKSRLDQLMNELNNNLPEINFEDNDNENEESNVEIRESDLNMFRDVNNDDDDDDDELVKLNSLLNNDKFDFKNEIFDNYDDNNDIITNKNLDELKDLKLTFSSTTFNYSNSNETNLSSAEQITKNIFNGKNSKLSMEKFNSLNIDEALNTFGHQKNSNDKWYTSLTKNQSTLNPTSISNNDENVLKKLAEMSMQISNNSELNNLNLKTGAITSQNSSMISLRNINSTILDVFTNNTNDRISSTNPFDIIEKELTQNTINKSNDIFNQDLDKFLKSHNIKDGNMIETRRIDLRASQHQDYTKQDPKNKIKSLFDNIVTQTSHNSSNSKNNNINNPKLKFLNETASESSSTSSSDEENESNDSKLLWIERYRRQKINLHNEK